VDIVVGSRYWTLSHWRTLQADGDPGNFDGPVSKTGLFAATSPFPNQSFGPSTLGFVKTFATAGDAIDTEHRSYDHSETTCRLVQTVVGPGPEDLINGLPSGMRFPLGVRSAATRCRSPDT
jgi:hypothetical protein